MYFCLYVHHTVFLLLIQSSKSLEKSQIPPECNGQTNARIRMGLNLGKSHGNQTPNSNPNPIAMKL